MVRYTYKKFQKDLNNKSPHETKDSIQYSKKPNKHSFCTGFVNLVTLTFHNS